MTWSAEAATVINRVHQSLPADATLAERKKAVDAAYPFGPRSHWPYKAWLKQRRQYLGKYGYRRQTKRLPETPLERFIRKGRK